MITPVLATSRALWFAARGLGITSLILLTASMVLGILTAGRVQAVRMPRFLFGELHRSISLLVCLFLGLHIASVIIDPYVTIRLVDAVVPFGGLYQPFWLGLGAIAFDLLVALTVASLIRHRLSFRAWKAVHWIAYLCWPVALVHGLGIGTDRHEGWMLAIDAACVLAVLTSGGWRLAVDSRRRLVASAEGAPAPC